MNIYFAGSIRGGRDDRALYLEIINYLRQYGEVLTEHVGDQQLSDFGEYTLSDEGIYQRDMDWLTASDVIVAEVTTTSLGVGYELGKAEELNKPVLCLYRPQPGKRLSAMLNGNESFKIEHYQTLEEAAQCIDKFMSAL
jgi:nucleoside 2-deoxyribosyltransferase